MDKELEEYLKKFTFLNKSSNSKSNVMCIFTFDIWKKNQKVRNQIN